MIEAIILPCDILVLMVTESDCQRRKKHHDKTVCPTDRIKKGPGDRFDGHQDSDRRVSRFFRLCKIHFIRVLSQIHDEAWCPSDHRISFRNAADRI